MGMRNAMTSCVVIMMGVILGLTVNYNVQLQLPGYTAKRMTDEFPEKSWTKHGVNELLKKLRDTGTVDRRPGSDRPRSARTEENFETENQVSRPTADDGNTSADNTSAVLHRLGLPVDHLGNVTSLYVVPNIVHFIWFADSSSKQLTFINYISILSAHRIQKPDSIWFHCNHLPSGDWWERLWREVPLRITHRDPPQYVHNQTIDQGRRAQWARSGHGLTFGHVTSGRARPLEVGPAGSRLHYKIYHRGDVAKLEILLQYGGIYLDYDVIVVNSLDPLRLYDATLGKEKKPKFCAGIILSRRNSTFMQLFYESYRDNYRPWDWDYNCAQVPYQLYLKNRDLLHVEPYKLTTPDWLERHKLWNEVIDWKDLYVIHVMGHQEKDYSTPKSIKTMDSTFGEVMRYIYYGSPEIITS